MPTRTPREATLKLIAPFGEVFRCVTGAGFVTRGSQPGGPFEAHFQGRVVPLRRRSGLAPLHLRTTIYYSIATSGERAGWWEARVGGWVYEIRSPSDDVILAFHWHPNSGRVTWPHLHAYGANEVVELHKLHAPTGPITAGSVVRFLIEDLEVVPRRQDWQTILDRHTAT